MVSGQWSVVSGLALVIVFASNIYAQHIAFLTPEKSVQSEIVSEKIETSTARGNDS